MTKQKGFTLIVVFFVMAIMLSVVLSLTMILLGQINTMKNFGNSVAAYYLTESGIEKTLYFDRREIPDVATRGFCNICSPEVCSQGSGFNNCNDCTLTALETSTTEGEEGTTSGCDITKCTDCQLTYNTSFNTSSGKKTLKVRAVVTQKGDFSETDIFSTGSFGGTYKTIQSHFSEDMLKSSKPIIQFANADPNSVLEGTEIKIYAQVLDTSNGIRDNGVVAHIQRTDGIDIATVFLTLSGTTYVGSWSGPVGVYYVDITACNKLGKCTTKDNI